MSEEILFSRDTFDEPEIEGNKKGESLRDIQSVEPAAFEDYRVEEQFDRSDAKKDEEILSSRDSSVGADNEMAWDENDTHEQTTEHTPVDGHLVEARPEETNKELYDEAPDETEQNEVQQKRKYARFQVHDAGVNGEMLFSEEVNLVDISTSGIALKVDRQLKIGREYLLSLHAEDEFISIKGEVIRSTLSETKTDSAGNIIPLYLVGMEFKNVSSNKAEQIDEFINNHKIDEVKIDTGCLLSGTRLRARFQLDSTDTYILDSQTSYKVKVLSLCGMMIESEQAISLNDSVQMKMSLPEDGTINILGRIVSHREIDVDPERYDIAIEFIEISEEDRGKLQTFLDGISDLQRLRVTSDGNDAQNEEVNEQPETDMEEPDSALAHEQYDRDPEAEKEASPQDTINLQLINLIEEIKLLLTQIRTELPGAAVSNTPSMETFGVSAETKECQSPTFTEPEMLDEDCSDDLQKVWQEEYVTVPEAVQKYISEQEQEMPPEEQMTESQPDIPGKKKLKLWYIAIPVLFLIAAIVSFLVLYSPEKQKVISQPVQPAQDKKQILPPAQPANVINEALPSVQKTPESAPVPAPEVKAASAAATSPAAPHTLELIASDSTWLSATIDDKAAKEMILRPGDRIKWTAKNSISLIIGNAAGLKLVFDGKEFGPLGEKGKVVKVKLPSSGNK